ncbi:polysaccharide biosynthesis tyrosine autokinase [Bacteroidota bacterium]|nr:polysaccharide biosynthesis tyrosine autokinase [Bacteroidota bacterium]
MNQDSNSGESKLTKDFDFKKEFFKYFYYWKFFVGSLIFSLLVSFTILRYTSKVYKASAKIKIIDRKDSSLEIATASELISKSKINLENEIEIIKSYPILSEVIKNKKLQISVSAVGDVMTTLSLKYPFEIKLKVPIENIIGQSYNLSITNDGFEIVSDEDDLEKYNFKGNSSVKFKHNFPFEIINFDSNQYLKDNNKSYRIQFFSLDELVTLLKQKITVSQVGDESEIIKLDITSTSSKYCELVLNELISVFNLDGIHDRQLVHKRTINFVNERYSFLSMELDSIEVKKQLYKVDNNLVDFSANSEISLRKINESEDMIFSLENQISIINLLINSLNENKFDLLPTNIGIENVEINSLISDFNQNILDRNKLKQSAGTNNPSVSVLDAQITDSRANIIYSLQNQSSQLRNLKEKLSLKFFKYDDLVSNLPEKERTLRAIERNQKIKEALYLFLLQKREEAEVNYAVTEPSIKVVEYAIAEKNPISPNSLMLYSIFLFLGLFVPFITLYLLFIFNRKIFSKDQFEELNLPIPLLSEIPEIVNQSNTTINSSNERSNLAESFRVLASKLKYFAVDNKERSQVTIVTSTIKGEGKTFCAVNLAFTKASLGKKVLLIGCDLHNPQIHSYIDVEKDEAGLVNFLVDNKFNWKKSMRNSKKMESCDILIAGQIPPNPAQLLNNGNFKILLDEARDIYDHIIVDTPPCLLVSDTLTLSDFADLVLFVVRCNHTNVNVLEFLRDSYNKGLIKHNSMIVLNGLGATNSYGYGYAYNYSYGYGYNYSYNYNYGYGYEYKSE